MALTSGTLLGSYAIVAPIGAGGMGEVYKARDTNLGREVAIKVLPEAFEQDRRVKLTGGASQRISDTPSVTRGASRLLFDDRFEMSSIAGLANYDVSSDGRFLMVESEENEGPAQLYVVLNWFEELKRRVPSDP